MKPYYEKDGITLHHGDCREVLPTLAAGSVDLVLTDPPYAISQSGVVHEGQPGKGSRRFDFFAGDTDWPKIVAMWEESLRLVLPAMAPHASLYAWVGHRMFGPTVQILEVAGYQTRFMVWVKECPAPPPPGAGWPSAAELCVYAWRPGRRWTHGGSNPPPPNVFTADSYRHGQPGKVNHPTQKPPAVILPLVKASALPGDTVLDPFAGSGTTLVVARDCGCKAIGIELEERYCEIAAKRLEQSVFQFTE